jgi:hypothetical protein
VKTRFFEILRMDLELQQKVKFELEKMGILRTEVEEAKVCWVNNSYIKQSPSSIRKRRKEKKEKREKEEREHKEKEVEEKWKEIQEEKQIEESENTISEIPTSEEEMKIRRSSLESALSISESDPIFLQNLNFQHLFGTIITCVGFIYSGVLIARGQLAVFSFIYFLLTFLANVVLLYANSCIPSKTWVFQFEKQVAGWRDSLFVFLPSELCLNALLAWNSDVEDLIAPFLLVVMDTFLFPKHFKFEFFKDC